MSDLCSLPYDELQSLAIGAEAMLLIHDAVQFLDLDVDRCLTVLMAARDRGVTFTDQQRQEAAGSLLMAIREHGRDLSTEGKR